MDKVVFLDRDGTINVEKNYLYKIEDFCFIDGVPEAIAMLNRQGYRVIVVSNQAGIARGYYKEQDTYRLHNYINEELKKWGAKIDAFYFCPHHPTAGIGKYKIDCQCRKPKIGLFKQACRNYVVDLEKSWMIGDNRGDIEAGIRFGLRTILVRTGYGKKLEEEGYHLCDYIADDLYSAVSEIILTDSGEENG